MLDKPTQRTNVMSDKPNNNDLSTESKSANADLYRDDANFCLPDGLAPDIEQMRQFLLDFEPEGPWHVTFIWPVGVPAPTEKKTKSGFIPNRATLETKLPAIAEHNRTGWNVYFSVAQGRKKHSKYKKVDLKGTRYLQLDIDSGDREVPVHLYRYKGGAMVPTFIIRSGNGWHAYWKLTEFIPYSEGIDPKIDPGKQPNLLAVEAACKTLFDLCEGADKSCFNADRIMRLPGTVNWPKQERIDSGAKPTFCQVANFDPTRVYQLSDFTSGPAQAEVPRSPRASSRPLHIGNFQPYQPTVEFPYEDIPELDGEEDVKQVLVFGYDPDNPLAFSRARKSGDEKWLYPHDHQGSDYPKEDLQCWDFVPRNSAQVPDRSTWMFKAICRMLRKGLSAALVAGLLISPVSAGVYGHVKAQQDPARYVQVQIQRAAKSNEERAQAKADAAALDAETTADAPSPEMADKIHDAAKRGANRKAGKLSTPTYIEELNEKHAVLLQEGGKVRVLCWSASEIVGDDREVAILQSFEDFRNRYMNRMVNVGTIQDPKWKPLGRVWLEHPARRQYLETRFMPGQSAEVGEYYNLWRDFAVKPKSGDWSLMKEHILSILAGGNQEYADYILNWAAWAVQHPDLPAEVALVFKGPKGAGKGIFARFLKGIFGQHGLHITSPAHLTGRFNAHLRDCCLLFADEAIAPGDRTAEAVLKGLITEPELPIEGKGVNVIQARNHLHVVMASNDDWVVPAGADERRFAVFEAARLRIGDRAYFNALAKQMENGGRAAMLHELLNRPIENWHPRQDVPDTEALREQKILGLKPEDQLILSILESGVLPGRRLNNKVGAVYSKSLYQGMRRTCPALRDVSETMLGRILNKWDAMGTSDGAARGRQFKPLLDMRADWEKKYGHRGWPKLTDSNGKVTTDWSYDWDEPDPPF